MNDQEPSIKKHQIDELFEMDQMKKEIKKLNQEIQQQKIQAIVAAMEKEMGVTYMKRELENKRAKSPKLEKELEETRFKLQTMNLGTRNDNNNNNNNGCCIM